MRKKRISNVPRWFEIVFFIVLFNLGISQVVSVMLGGTTSNGKIVRGRYYLGGNSRFTEVSATTFRYRQYHEIMTISSALLSLLGILFYLTVSKNWRERVTRGLISGFQCITSYMITPFFHSAILCRHCLRYTNPFQSRYKQGKRYCEHCQHDVEQSRIPGKVMFAFGIFSLTIDGQDYTLTQSGFEALRLPNRVIVYANPGFKTPKHRIDVSEIYIDTKTCDSKKLERAITYMCHYLPHKRLHSMRIFYQGRLDDLGEHLQHTLQNTFQHIERMT